MNAIHGLSFCRRVKLRLHDKRFVGFGQIETETAGADGNEDDGDGGIGVEEGEGAVAGFAGHAAVEADEGVGGGG